MRDGEVHQGAQSKSNFLLRENSVRQASIHRDTTETQIKLSINLDGNGTSHFDTGLPFFDHMLTQIARHGMIDIHVEASGDLEVDAHHMVEDIGIVLGQALNEAVGDKSGLTRYGHAYVPLDEALSRAVIDLSGRPGLHYRVDYTRARVGEFDVDLLREFFQGLVNHSMMTLHLTTCSVATPITRQKRCLKHLGAPCGWRLLRTSE